MSRLSKVVVTILVIVLVVLLIMWYVPLSNSLSTGTLPPVESLPTTSSTASTTPTSTPQLPKSDVAARDASDASLEADLTLIDEQISKLSEETTAVDASMNDKPITQPNP